MQIAAAGDRALLVTLRSADARRLRAAAESARMIPQVEAAIIGHESVLVIGANDRDAVIRCVEHAAPPADNEVTEHRIEVSFAREHGLDFEALIARAQISRESIVERIAALRLTARYLGFRAGFAYLEGWPEELSLPRRPTSRNRVPGGSFAVAGTMAGFYPDDSPGGWNVLGRTDLLPRLRPGDEIRIVPVDRALQFAPQRQEEERGEIVADVVTPGQLTMVAGARVWKRAEEGESPGGRFDEAAAAIANRAAGNADDAPLLECVLVGPRLRFRNARRVAWCGPTLEPRAWLAAAGEEVDIGRIRDAFRGYLAIEGGVASMRKVVTQLNGAPPPSAAKLANEHRKDRLTIRVVRGPHEAPPLPERWEVTPNINRVGIRLRPLTNPGVTLSADLPSCGMQFGTVQWHPDGSAVVMGPDHPVTGGYLQPATVISADLWKLGQLAPGEQLRLI